MIGEESDWMGRALEVMTPMVQGMKNSEEFMIVDVVILFCRGEHLREIRTRMKIPIIIFLHEDSSTGKERSVGHDDEGFADFWETKYQSGLKAG